MALKEYSPVEAFEYSLARLWLLVLLALFGSGLAWLFHRTRAPLYEAKAVLVVNIDLPRSEPLSPFEIDHGVGGAGSLMISTSVMEKFLQGAQELHVLPEELVYGRSLFRERKQERWELRVRHPDPLTAADLANLWANISYLEMNEALRHAQRAAVLRQYLAAIESCQPPPNSDPELPELCKGRTLPEIQDQVQAVGVQLEAETAASRGLIPSLLIDFSQQAQTPDKAVAYNTNVLMLAGALLGFLIGVVIVSARVLP